ncbi:MAG TPA: TilS substrate-binding domain-containing protein, partial [Angustibacter sp.]|nr:TilS substrate-binding domain-containing protein [Angustibacter sp.]
RLRHDALPALERALGARVVPALARTAQQLRDDADALDGWAREVVPACTGPDGALDPEPLAALPPAVLRRVLRAAVLDAGAPAGAVSARHLDALAALVTGWHGQGAVSLPGGLEGRRCCGRLLLGAPQRRQLT